MTSAGKALERAEKIKTFSDGTHKNDGSASGGAGTPSASSSSSVLTPVGINQFSPRMTDFSAPKLLMNRTYRGAILRPQQGWPGQWSDIPLVG